MRRPVRRIRPYQKSKGNNMKFKYVSSTVALVGLLAASTAAFGQTVDVQQYWTSASESKAMHAIADEFKARGGKWIDSPSADFDAALAAATSRIAGGEPPTALLMTPNSAMRDLAGAGSLRNLNDLATEGGWQKQIPEIVWNKLNVDGNLVALPVGIHADNWLYYSKEVFSKYGIEEPKSLDEMFAVADKLKAAGVTAFAVGGEPWQEAMILWDLILAVGGPEYYNQLVVKRDPEAMKSPVVEQAFEMYRRISTYVDPSSPGRSWNDTTNMIINGKAGMQLMGDWARGEFIAAGKKPGEDFGCMIVPGKLGYQILVDVFVFPQNTDEDRVSGQTLLAKTIMDTKVEAKIAEVKGSIPSRLDVDTSSLDACAAKGVEALATPGVAVSDFIDALPGDLGGRANDIATQFWTDPSMTPKAGAEALISLLQSE
jgi:glucose/mannose transport system substrate-binding protein